VKVAAAQGSVATYRLSSPDMADWFAADENLAAVGASADGVQVHLTPEAVELLRGYAPEGVQPYLIDSAGILWIAGIDHEPMPRGAVH
jgi:hypothetical protein